MAPKRKTTREPPYDWTEEKTYAFLKLVLEAQRKNGPNQTFSWPDMSNMFEQNCKITAPAKVMKDKYRNMGKKYEKWCKLVNGETGLGWDSVKRTVVAPPEWWDKKIQEDGDLKAFRNVGIPPEMQELLEGIFGGLKATGCWCPTSGTSRSTPADFDVGGCCTPLSADELDGQNELEAEMTGMFGPVETGAPGHLQQIVREITESAVDPLATTQSPTIVTSRSNRKRGQEKQPQTDSGRGSHRNIRQSTGKTLWNEHILQSMEASKAVVSMCNAEVQSSAQASHVPVDPEGESLKVLDSMVEEGLLGKGEQLYFFAVSNFQKSDRFVNFFLKLGDHALRLGYLQYEKERDDQSRTFL